MKNTQALQEFIGIDVSKDTIDVFIFSSQSYKRFANNKLNEFFGLLQWVNENSKYKKGERIFVFEHTGIYSENLAEYLSEQGELFSIVPGLEIKRSKGISRGKTDKADARQIAYYAKRFIDKLELTVLPSKSLRELKKLGSEREFYVKQSVMIQNRIAAIKSKAKGGELLESEKHQLERLKGELKNVKELITEVEKEIDKVISSQKQLLNQRKLLMSIPGIGPVTATALIVYTEGFTRFNDWRKFASYSGIAPFPYSSGKSVRGRTKISYLANKRIKYLLHLATLKAIKYDPFLKDYYERKLAEGKNPMKVQNAVRNKLLSRAFAVIRLNRPFVETSKYLT